MERPWPPCSAGELGSLLASGGEQDVIFGLPTRGRRSRTRCAPGLRYDAPFGAGDGAFGRLSPRRKIDPPARRHGVTRKRERRWSFPPSRWDGKVCGSSTSHSVSGCHPVVPLARARMICELRIAMFDLRAVNAGGTFNTNARGQKGLGGFRLGGNASCLIGWRLAKSARGLDAVQDAARGRGARALASFGEEAKRR